MHNSTLSRTSFPRSRFFLFEPVTGHSHAASVQHDLTTPSFVFLVPPIFSPSLKVRFLDIATTLDESGV